MFARLHNACVFIGMLVNWMKGAGVVNSSFCRKAP